MGVFQVIFIAINLYVPYWIWNNTSRAKSAIEWNVFEKNLARLIESDEGFPECETLQLVEIFRELCETSNQKIKDGKSVVMERASPQVVFHCGFTPGNINVGWRLENSKDGDLECGDPGGDVVARSPSFNFTLTGRIKSIGFVDANGNRETMPYRNCRTKAAHLKIPQAPAPDLDVFLNLIGKTPGDPEDYITGNLLCLAFDSSNVWRTWRDHYLR